MSIQPDRLIALFKELVSINAPALAERDCVDFVRARLEAMGLECREDDAGGKIGGNAGNLIARLPATRPGLPSIFFSAHFDTVEPTAGLKIIDDGEVIRTDGTTILGADDKGGMAPAIEAVQALIESGEGHGDVWLLFTVAEEIGLLGAANLDIQALGVDFGYVLDTGPPVGSLVTRTATHDLLNARIIGRPAHAGKHPEEGINAISVAADALTGMKLGRISPQTTANFGLVVGGTAVNVVCPWVELKGEARSNDPAELDEQIAHMKAKLQEAAERWGAQVEIEHDRHYVAYQLADDSPVVATARSLFQELGYSGELRTTLGGSDANMSNAHGVPTAVLGTGMDKIHTHEEFIRREDLVSLAEVTLALIRRVAGTI